MALYDYHPCRPPYCKRFVSAVSIYCCTPCGNAAEGKYEIDEHSEGCDERDRIRRPAAPSRVDALERGQG